MQAKVKQPQKLIPFESKYRDKRFSHVPQGIINPLHVYKDPRKPEPKIEITVESSKVKLMSAPTEKTFKTRAYIPEDLKSPFIYIKQLVSKSKQRNSNFWNKSANVTSLRVDRSVQKKEITDRMARSIPKINDEVSHFQKTFIKNLHRLLGMKLYDQISQVQLELDDLFQGFCRLKRLKKEGTGDMLVTEKQFIDFLNVLGWEKAGLPAEDAANFFQLARIDDKNIYFLSESKENQKETRDKSDDEKKELQDSSLFLASSKKFDEELKKTAVARKPDSLLSIKALIFNYEKFHQEKARIKSLTSNQSSFARGEILRNLLENIKSSYKENKLQLRQTLYSRIGFLILKNPSEIPQAVQYDKLRRLCDEMTFEQNIVAKFLNGKKFPEELNPEVLLKSLEALQKKDEDEVKVMGQFVQEFKKEKEHFKEQEFTLLELVDFIYERKYSRKDFDILTKMINKLKRLYNYSQNFLPDDEIKPKHHIDLSFLTQTLNGICHKAYLSSEILSTFIERLNTLILKNIEHYKPKNPEIHQALLHNLALDYTIKFLGNLAQKIEKIMRTLNNVHSQIEDSPEIQSFLEEKTYYDPFPKETEPQPITREEDWLPGSRKNDQKEIKNTAGGLSFGPGLFQKAKNNTKLQKLMKILRDNLLELNDEFALGIHIPTPNTTEGAKPRPKGPSAGFLSPKPESPQITVTVTEENEYYSNIKKNPGEKAKNWDLLAGKDLKDIKEKEGHKHRLSGSKERDIEDDDEAIDILNTQKIGQYEDIFNAKPEKGSLGKNTGGLPKGLARSRAYMEEKKKKPLKIIKKNYLEIPEILEPFSIKTPLDLEKIRPFRQKIAFAEFDFGLPQNERLETDDEKLKTALGGDPFDFKSTTKSFFVGDRTKPEGQRKDVAGETKKLQFSDQFKKKDDKMSEINKWMESTIAKKDAEKAKKAEALIKNDDGSENLNLSQILKQAKQMNSTLRDKSFEKGEKPGANRLEDTLNQSYYKPDAVEIGKYAVKSDLFREYELYLPVDYYTQLTRKESDKAQWYVRPHHIETVTEHPLSHKDNVLDTKYQSWLEPMERQLNPKEKTEKDRKEKKEELINDLEIRLRKLQEELELKKATNSLRKNGSFMDSHVRDKQKQGLMTSSYETMLHELRKEEKDMLNKKRSEFSLDVGAPEERWWEKKGKEFARELKKHDLLNYKPQDGHSDYVNRLQIKELY